MSRLVQRIGRSHNLWNTPKNSQGLLELACSRAAVLCLVSRRRTGAKDEIESFSVSGDRLRIHKPFSSVYVLFHGAPDFYFMFMFMFNHA